MWNDIEDPYEKVLRLENEILQLWIVNEQLSEQLKLQSELNVKLTEHMKAMSRGLDQLSNMIQRQHYRIERLENEKTSSRPIR